MDWTKTGSEIPTYNLDANPHYWAEKLGLGSWVAIHDGKAIENPGSLGSLDEAKAVIEAEYRAEGAVQHARWVFENYRARAAAKPADQALAELVRRSYAALTAAEEGTS